MKEKKEDSESEEEYEIDTEKARKALQNLDQQLQSFSAKQISSPKLKGMNYECLWILSSFLGPLKLSCSSSS